MMLMLALCACRASERSHGPTCWLMYADSALSLGSCTAWTSVMRPLEITTRTWTSPKRLGKSEPVNVPLSAVVVDGEGVGDGVADGVTDGVTGGEVVEVEGDGLVGLEGVCGGDTGVSAVDWAVTL